MANPFEDMPFVPEETRFVRDPLGPASQNVCRVTSGNSCGSGSLVGKRNGKSLAFTNAHVIGSRVGKRGEFTFPHLNNKRVGGRIIMAAYSDRIMMDWAVCELDEEVDLPHHPLNRERPAGRHYTAGYPRCQGPFYQEVVTRDMIHNGTVWRWTPNSIGGQSGSGIHSFDDDTQKGILTWSWGGLGAGQTLASVWFQFVNRAAVGFERPEGLIELTEPENRAEDLENGFFMESNITQLPIWSHLIDKPDPPIPADPEFAKAVLEHAKTLQKQVEDLVELARAAGTDGDSTGTIDKESDDPGNDDLIFGLPPL